MLAVTENALVHVRTLTTPRSAALSGVIFAITFTASVALLHRSIPEDPFADPSWAEGASTGLTIALTLMPMAGIAFLWFLGVVRDRQGDLEDRFFSTVYFGSGLLFLAMIFVSTAIAGGIKLTIEADPSATASPDVVAFGRSVMLQVTNVYAVRMAAVLMISLATTWHRTGVMPRWLVLSTYLVALLLLLVISVSVWTALVFPAWVLMVSVLVLVAARRKTTGRRTA
jgi:hypothetical protein